jgi:DnaK suppressor protein
VPVSGLAEDLAECGTSATTSENSMTDTDKRLEQLRKLKADILDLREVRDQGAGVVELDQSRTGRLSRVDSLQRQAIAQHGQRLAEEHLRKIEAAIRRCLEGRYGRCLACDEPIAEARLDVDPAAVHCIECAEGLNQKD